MRQDLKKIALSILTLGLILVLVRGCDEGLPSETVRGISILPVVSKRIAQETSKRLLPQNRPPYVPPEGTVTIKPKDPTKTLDEVIDIRVKYFGLCFKPGIQATFPLGVGLDAKLAFYRRYGAGAVFLLSKEPREVNAALFASRHIGNFDNIEAVVGLKFTGNRLPYVGLRLSF